MLKILFAGIICYGIFVASPEFYTQMVGWIIDVDASVGFNGAMEVLTQPDTLGGYGLHESVAYGVYFLIPLIMVWVVLFILFLIL